MNFVEYSNTIIEKFLEFNLTLCLLCGIIKSDLKKIESEEKHMNKVLLGVLSIIDKAEEEIRQEKLQEQEPPKRLLIFNNQTEGHRLISKYKLGWIENKGRLYAAAPCPIASDLWPYVVA